jgi:hypothetical protein
MDTPFAKVILITRSYNDLDCRLPLLREFSSRWGLPVSVLVIPTVSSSGYRVTHPFLSQLKIPCVYAIDLLRIKWVRYVCFWTSRFVEQSPVQVLSYRVWTWLWRKIYDRLSKSSSISSGVLHLTSDALLIIDDILTTPSRSFIVPLLANNCFRKLFCLSHGQNTYLNLWHDKPRGPQLAREREPTLIIYTPSDNDGRIFESNYKGVRAATIGNTRFDRDWILNYQEKLLGSEKKLLPFRGTKIGFMMSKMEYGLNPADVFELINKLASRDNTKIVLKPHTRGMSLRKYTNLINGKAIIADDVSSSEIINWSDIIIFTGSSIVFEAMIKRKRVLFLAALQKYRTIFDELPTMAVFKAGADLDEAISRIEHGAYDYGAIDEFLASHTHNHVSDGRVCAVFAERVISELAN